MAGHAALKAVSDKMVSAISIDPPSVAQTLFVKGLITRNNMESLQNQAKTDEEKARKLVQLVLKLVDTFSENYEVFLEVISEHSWLENLAKLIQKTYDEQVKKEGTPKPKSNQDLSSNFKKFPYLNAPELSAKKKDRLLGRLMAESEAIRIKFTILVDRTRGSLMKQGISSQDIKLLVEYSKNIRLYSLFEREVEITDLFFKLREYLSFFDYDFVGMIVERHCPELINDLEAYKSELKIYCRRRVVEVPSDVFEREGADETCLFVKCDKSFESITLDDIKALQSRLSNFLDTDLCLLRVDDGCTEVVFNAMCPIPPLTKSQRTQLSEMGILKLYSVHFQDLPSHSLPSKHLAHQAEQKEFQLTGDVQLQQETDEKCEQPREERDMIQMEVKRVAEIYERKSKATADLEEENRHLQTHMNELQEKLEVVLVEKKSMEDHVRHLEGEKISNERLHAIIAVLNHQLKYNIQEGTEKLEEKKLQLHIMDQQRKHDSTEWQPAKDQLLSKYHALEQQRKHDHAEWQVDRTNLEKAITDMCDENMSLAQQLKQAKLQAERKFQSMKKQIEEECEALEMVRAQSKSEKMDQERQVVILKRELEQLRSQTFGNDIKFTATFRGMEEEKKELQHKLELLQQDLVVQEQNYEALQQKHSAMTDEYVQARDTLNHHGLPLPRRIPMAQQGSTGELPVYNVRPFDPVAYSISQQQQLSSSDGNQKFHHLGDYGERKKVFSQNQGQPPALMSHDSSSQPVRKQFNKPTDYDKQGMGQNYPPPRGQIYQRNYSCPPAAPQLIGGARMQGHTHSPPGDNPPPPPIHHHPQQPATNVPSYSSYGSEVGGSRPSPPPMPHSPGPNTHAQQQQQQQQPQKPPPQKSQENLLLQGLVSDICEAAKDVKRELVLDSLRASEESWPLDSNLICPMCKTQFRIGQIQHYKKHVDTCTGEPRGKQEHQQEATKGALNVMQRQLKQKSGAGKESGYVSGEFPLRSQEAQMVKDDNLQEEQDVVQKESKQKSGGAGQESGLVSGEIQFS